MCSVDRKADLVAENVCVIDKTKKKTLGAKVLVAKTVCFIEQKRHVPKCWLQKDYVLSYKT